MKKTITVLSAAAILMVVGYKLEIGQNLARALPPPTTKLETVRAQTSPKAEQPSEVAEFSVTFRPVFKSR